ncbi:MFS transporter [Virgibacillus sp. MG-45]|uniref:MFS transporter n=1 Tax=Virgibacillus sp. MG-45 TaxID=3102791 RepID=UPI002EDBA7FF
MKQKLKTNRSFLLLLSGNAISELGGAFGTFCNSVLIYQWTGSTLALSSMWLLYFLPSLVLQLFIGPFIDLWSRKWLMIISQWIRGTIFLIPLTATIFNQPEPWTIYAVQTVIGLITPVYTPAMQAILPTIIPKEQLITANGIVDGMTRTMTFLGPLLGGIVVELAGAQWTLAFISTLFLTSGGLLLIVKEATTTSQERKAWAQQFSEGITFFFRQPAIAWLAFFLAIVQFGVGVTMVITLPYITEELTGSNIDYGYFMAGFPFGYVIGTMLVGKIKLPSIRMLMLGSLTVGGLTFIALGLNQSIILAIAIEATAGAALGIFGVHNTTIFQLIVPNHIFGKIASVRLVFIRAAIPIGVFCGGILSEWFGIRPLYFLIGTLICTISLSGMLLPYFKILDHAIAEKIS